MKRMKRYVAWLMAICMLNVGGAWNCLFVNAEVADTFRYVYTDLVSVDASGNRTATVSVVDVASGVTELSVPATYASADASGEANYDITKFAGITYASGDASGNALKIIGFEGAIPQVEGVSGYYVKVLKQYASGKATEDLKRAVGEDKYYVVSSLSNKIMTVTNPTQYQTTLAGVANAIKAYDVATGAEIGSKTVTWYSNAALTTEITGECESGKTYYYKINSDGYETYTGSIQLSSDTFQVEKDKCVLTCNINISDDNTKTASILKAEYIDGYTYNAADIYSIPAIVSKDSVNYTVTRIEGGAFGKECYFTSYYIPASVTEVGTKAFYCENAWDSTYKTLLLRFGGTAKDTLPKFNEQFNDCNNFGLVFSNAADANTLLNAFREKNNQGINTNAVYYVAAPATDRILKKGTVTATPDKALYTNHLSDIALTATGFKDFQTGADVAVTPAWVNPYYAFSFIEGAKDCDYTCTATGYAAVVDKIHITPYAASGFTYEYDAATNTLLAAGYGGADKVVRVPDSESDATGATYVVSGISSNFKNNSQIEELTLGVYINNIKEYAFTNCPNMVLKVDPANTLFTATNGFLYSKDGTKLIAAPSARSEVFLPEGVAIIGDYAFMDNKKIQTLVIPTTVTKLGESKDARCFQGCDQLDTIKFCNTNPALMSIGSGVFHGALKNICVPTGTTAAYEALFKNYNVWYGNATIKEWVPTTSKLVTLTDFQAVTITPTDNSKPYTWTSDNTALVVVTPAADGKSATIHAADYSGVANVTALAADGTSTSWQVTVNIDGTLANPWAADAYTLQASKTSVTMGAKVGKKADVATITISASNKSAITIQSVKSSNKKIVTVSKKGNKVLIQSTKKKGSAKVTVTDSLGKKVVIKVQVKAAPKKAVLKKKSVTIKKKKTYTIALKGTNSAKLTYKTSNKKVATVNSSGVVTGKKKGNCKITVTTYNGKKATLKVKVK